MSDLNVLETKLEHIEEVVNEIKKKLESGYVTRDEFVPVKNIVYGMASTILLGFVVALVRLLWKG